MDCPNCKLSYDKSARVPLLLIKCGHSLCQACANSLYSNRAIMCPECKQSSTVESIAQLPKNMALLVMSENVKSSQGSPQKSMCETHHKKLEGFCEDDKQLLCINCILLDGHKVHEISPIGQAAAGLRARLMEDVECSKHVEDRIKGMINDISGFKVQLTANANAKREQITAIYKEISNIIHERESSLKQTVANILEREEEILQKRAEDLAAQLKTIEKFRESVHDSTTEGDCELLEKTETRQNLAESANKLVVAVTLNANFPEVRKESELGILWKLLSPPVSKKGTVTSRLGTKVSKNGGAKAAVAATKVGIAIADKQATLEKLMAQGATALPQKHNNSKNAVKARASTNKVNISATSSNNSSITSPRKLPLKNSQLPFEEESVCADSSSKSSPLHEVPPAAAPIFGVNKPPTATVPAAVVSASEPKPTPFVSHEEISATTHAIVQATSRVNLIQHVKSDDIYSALREKREKHKLEKAQGTPSPVHKIELLSAEVKSKSPRAAAATPPAVEVAVVHKISPTSCKGPEKPVDFGGALKAAWCDGSEIEPKSPPDMNDIKIEQVVIFPERATIGCSSKVPKNVPSPLAQPAETVREEDKKSQSEQSITPTLYDMYINGEANDKMSLSTLLERLNEYIYVFCMACFECARIRMTTIK